MKFLSIFLLTAFLYTTVNVNVFGSNNPDKPSKILQDQKSEIDKELLQLDELSNFIQSEKVTFQELSKLKAEYVKDLNLKSNTNSSAVVASRTDRVLGIPGFLWGFCLGLIGILIVYIAMDEGVERKKEVRSALIGCIVWTVLYVILYSAGVFADATPAKEVVETIFIA